MELELKKSSLIKLFSTKEISGNRLFRELSDVIVEENEGGGGIKSSSSSSLIIIVSLDKLSKLFCYKRKFKMYLKNTNIQSKEREKNELNTEINLKMNWITEAEVVFNVILGTGIKDISTARGIYKIIWIKYNFKVF